MNLAEPSGFPAEVPIVLASLTPPVTAYDQMIESELGTLEQAYTPPSGDANVPADAPPEPEPVIAEPGTLTPTPEGTRGPENILIYSGRPPLEARARPVVEPPADPLAEFRPRSRPYGIHTSFFGWQFQAYLFQCIELAFKDWTYELQFWRFWRPAS